MGIRVQKLVGYGNLGPKISGIWDFGSTGYGKPGHKISGIWGSWPYKEWDMGEYVKNLVGYGIFVPSIHPPL